MTRAHGLEHLYDERARRAAETSGPPLSRRYFLYHGGYRLWEVDRSLTASDHCVLLNAGDRDYVRDRLDVPAERLSVIPNGIPDYLVTAPDVKPVPGRRIRIAFIGRWTTYKGRHTLVEAADRLERIGIDFSLSILGTGDEPHVVDHFAPETRGKVTVVPRFANRDLVDLLRDHEVFAFPTLSEGASVSLMEAMACGLAPVATAVGAAPELIDHGVNGLLVEVEDPAGLADALARLARGRGTLDEMRGRAQATARRLGWDEIAARTLSLYRSVLTTRSV